MESKNLPCSLFVKNKKCDGELILIDGTGAQTRLKCNKCATVVTLPTSLIQYAMELKEWLQKKR